MARAARPSGSPRADLVHKAICAGHIQWKDSAVRIMRQDEKTKGFTTKAVNEWLRQYVLDHGSSCVRHKQETREYWLEVNPDDPWWYKVNIEFADRPARLFVEMKLVDPDPNGPWTEVVNCHF